QYLRHLGRQQLEAATIHLHFSALRSLYKHLNRQGIMDGTPLKNLILPKLPKRLPRFLTREQMLDLLNAPMTLLQRMKDSESGEIDEYGAMRDTAVLELFYSSGLRISELCRMQVRDIDREERLIRVLG